MASFNVVIDKTFTRNEIAEELVCLAINSNLVVFGGYVRDMDILKLDTFNDIDLACFSSFNYRSFLRSVRSKHYNITVCDIKTTQAGSYAHMSTIILNVITFKVSGAYGMNFPENMHISIDIVMHKSRNLWESTHDIDFSCNLFYRDNKSISLRYIPNIDIGEANPFLYWHQMTQEKKFFIVMLSPDKLQASQLKKLLYRAESLVDKNWDLKYTKNDAITLGIYQTIKLENKTQCSICLDEFSEESKIINTSCKHSFCYECFQKMLGHTHKCPNCRTEICAPTRKYYNNIDHELIEVD